MGEAMHVWWQRIHGKYLYLPLNFAVKASLKKTIKSWEFPGVPVVAKTVLPRQAAWV